MPKKKPRKVKAKPEKNSVYSTITFRPDTHKRLKYYCVDHHLSMSAVINEALELLFEAEN